MARIKVFDEVSQSWVYADKSFGKNGVSPTVEVSKTGKVTTISITDKNGTKTATINDGADAPQETVLFVEQTLTEEQKTQARENIGAVSHAKLAECGLTKAEKDLILTLFENTAYTSNAMGDILSQLKTLWNGGEVDPDEPVYKWVLGVNGSAASADNEAILDFSTTRAMCLAKDAGVTLRYGNGAYVATEMSPYSPVVIPEGSVSVTVKCPGVRIGFNELKLENGKWIRLFSSDNTPVADEATYIFRSTESTGLYIKLRHITNDKNALPDLPETVDITFNYADEPEPEPEPEGDGTYKWVVGLNGSAGTNEVAVLAKNNPQRAVALSENTGVPLSYGITGNDAGALSPYSPVVIPDGAVSATVKCPGFRISFNELKLVDSTWYRQFTGDSTPVADEATYTFKSAESNGLYIKLRHITEDWANLSGVPETLDITFNYTSDSEPVYEWIVGYNASYASADSEAMLISGAPHRAICGMRGKGIPLASGANHVVNGYTDISPVLIPEGAKSITVRCPGFRICFNELKLAGDKWYRLFTSDTDGDADEATYAISSADASGLYVKLKHITDNYGTLADVPQFADITFNY